jgi:hypothetical protein
MKTRTDDAVTLWVSEMVGLCLVKPTAANSFVCFYLIWFTLKGNGPMCGCDCKQIAFVLSY